VAADGHKPPGTVPLEAGGKGLPFRVWVEKSRAVAAAAAAEQQQEQEHEHEQEQEQEQEKRQSKEQRQSRTEQPGTQSRQKTAKIDKRGPAMQMEPQMQDACCNRKRRRTLANGRYQRQNTKGFGYGQRAPE
jgi:hypothetical protein